MNPLKNEKYARLAVVAGLIVVADQISKEMVQRFIPLYHSISVIPGCFNLTHIHNPGGAFGFLAGQSPQLRQVIFIFASSLAIGLIFYFYRSTPRRFVALSFGFSLIFGGAIGNLIDRLRFGKVVDFLDAYLGTLHWPAFNVADSAITVGIGIFLFHLIFQKLPE
ncbi:MAG: signal peptidase II [Desulfobacterales bacterium]|nr:signal peptidase II [Desulfobacterales bacterium]